MTYLFDCNENQIGLNKEDCFQNKSIIYYHGNLNLSELMNLEGVTLPQIVKGILNLGGMTNQKDVILPIYFDKILLKKNIITLENING